MKKIMEFLFAPLTCLGVGIINFSWGLVILLSSVVNRTFSVDVFLSGLFLMIGFIIISEFVIVQIKKRKSSGSPDDK